MSIDETVRLVSVGLVLAGLLAIWLGWREVLSAGRLPFFLLRRERAGRGWGLVFGGFAGALLGGCLQAVGRPVAFSLLHATASVTPSATRTTIPSATLTPTVSLTPSTSDTPTVTPTPSLPDAVSVLLIHDTVTPNPDAVFSPLQIARQIDLALLPIDPQQDFENPIDVLYATFTYNRLQDGVRWTAVWYQSTEIVCLETQSWQSGTGGYGYSECVPSQGWQPGEYEVQLFYAERWMVSSSFRVLGLPPSVTPSLAPSPSATEAG